MLHAWIERNNRRVHNGCELPQNDVLMIKLEKILHKISTSMLSQPQDPT